MDKDKRHSSQSATLRKCLKCGRNGVSGTMVETANGYYHRGCSDKLTAQSHLKPTDQLPDNHLEVAKTIAKESRYLKRSCSKCYDRAWIGTNSRNELVLCHKCVDSELAVANWKKYVRAISMAYAPGMDAEIDAFLKEYKWALEDDNTTTEIAEITEGDSHTEDTDGHGNDLISGNKGDKGDVKPEVSDVF